jgi:TonB-dependent starch-binding outer membrane protein SusC
VFAALSQKQKPKSKIMKRRILLLFFICLSIQCLFAQTRVIQGRITAQEDGDAVPGVNVVVKGTTTGTISDADGNFSIEVPEGAEVLTFSFIGMRSQDVVIGGRSTIDVIMGVDVSELSEIVVTGYGTQERRTMTGSVSSVNGAELHNLPIQSLDKGIQGRAAGVQVTAASGAPGGAVTVRIRGIGSVNGNNDPLWIIDGVQVARLGQSGQASSNPLAAINPNDIESVDFLKDAAASAIYGAQAANGVVVVTTKKGSGPASFNFSMQKGVVQAVGQYEVLDAQRFAELKEVAHINAGNDLDSPTGAHTLYGNPNDPSTITNYNWVDALFRDARLNTYDLSVSGGDAKNSFLLSGSYQEQEGQVIKSDWKRGTMRLNLNHKASEKLSFGANIALSYQRQFGTIADGNFVNGAFSAVYTMQPNSPALNDNGKFNNYPLSGSAHNFNYNIIQGVEQEVRIGRTGQTVSSVNASYAILPGLTLAGFAGLDASFNRDDNQRPATIPAFASSGGQVALTYRRTFNYNTNGTLSYEKTLNEKHKVSVLAGYEYKVQQREVVSASQFNFPDNDLRLLSSGATARPATEVFGIYKRQGVFSQFKYSFKDKYIADATLRRDGSSRFGEKKRYGNFYAGSLAWRLSEEEFISSLNLFSDLKFRIAYGVVGNSEINDFDPLNSFGAGPSGHQYLGGPILRPTRLGNDLITWEEESQFNVGLDYGILQGRLFGSVEYYKNVTSQQLFNVQLPIDSGFPSVRGNAGEVLNSGIEVQLGGVLLDRSGLNWRASLNFSTLHNELTALPGGVDRIGNTQIVGEPIAFNYVAIFAGVNPANGKAVFRDVNGNLSYSVSQDDLVVDGSPTPTYFGGLTNTISFKGVKLDFLFQYSGGNRVFNADLFNIYDFGTTGNNQLVDVYDRYWRAPGQVTNVPKPIEGGVIDGNPQVVGSSQYISDGSYVRLKQITLSYDLPTALLSKIKLKKASVFIQGMNLWTYSTYYGIDPEVASNPTIASGAIGNYVVPRQYSAGISLGF